MTAGDPAGIGPEVALLALEKIAGRRPGDKFLVIGGGAACESVFAGAGRAAVRKLSSGAKDLRAAIGSSGGRIFYLPVAPPRVKTPAGRPSRESGSLSCEFIFRAAALASAGAIDALVTAPISKEAVSMAGYPWPGHTEMLAELFGSKRVEMAFFAKGLRLVLTTRHVPLASVARSLTVGRVEEAARAAADFAICLLPGAANFCVVVLGLNPHAGEHGLFGREEERVIAPAVASAKSRVGEKYPGKSVEFIGPLPADSAFAGRRAFGPNAVFLAHYHDQGLIPFKMLHFSTGVNVTLGLPVVRTSPDHGTAFDIAGKKKPDPSSMMSAIGLASRISPVALD